MNLLRILILSLLLPACATSESAPPATVDSELYSLYEEFYIRLAIARLPARAKIRSMYYVDSIDPMGAAEEDQTFFTAGVCSTYQALAEPALDAFLGRGPHLYTYRVITISRATTPDRLKAVVFHELAHCILDLLHSCEATDIMYPVPPEYSDAAFERMLDTYESGGRYGDCE